ncbi:hypothetical protein [Minisyncoccus archaeiphilus]|uniref:hypothetical protein n=1 Tax=Minisyncoccus archaeiphilus TaxID=3238481 RepID=UPI00399C6604
MKIDYKIFYTFLLSFFLIIIVFILVLPPLVMKSFSIIEDGHISEVQEGVRREISHQLNYLDAISISAIDVPCFNLQDSGLEADYWVKVSSNGIVCNVSSIDGEGGKRLSDTLIKSLVMDYDKLKKRSGLVHTSEENIAISIFRKGDDYVIAGKRLNWKIPSSPSNGHFFTIEKIIGTDFPGGSEVITKSDPNRAYAYAVHEDIYGKGIFYTKAVISREVYKTGLSQLQIIFYLVFLSQLIFLIIFLFVVRKIITDRLDVLINALRSKKLKGDDFVIPVLDGDDEISILSKDASKSFQKIKEFSKEIEYKQSQLDSILMSMHDSVFIFDQSGKLISSYVFEGGDQSKFVSYKSKKNGFPSSAMSKIVQAIDKIKQGEEFVNVRYSIRKSKKVNWYDANISSKKDKKGNFDGVIVVARDITERIDMEKGISDKLSEMKRLNRLMVDRELKMIELKKKIKELEKEI